MRPSPTTRALAARLRIRVYATAGPWVSVAAFVLAVPVAAALTGARALPASAQSLPASARSLPASAQSVADFVPEPARGSDFPLSVRSIMRGPELVGQAPSQVRWTDDGARIYFRWLPGGNDWDAETESWRVRADGTDPERVPDEAMREMAPLLASGDVSSDGRWEVVASDGDLYRVDRRDGSVERLTDTREDERDPRFMPDGGILYRSGDNLFRLWNGRVTQITEREAEGAPEPLYIPDGERLAGLAPSADGSHVLVSVSRQARDARRTLVPEWVTESGYTEERNRCTEDGALCPVPGS